MFSVTEQISLLAATCVHIKEGKQRGREEVAAGKVYNAAIMPFLYEGQHEPFSTVSDHLHLSSEEAPLSPLSVSTSQIQKYRHCISLDAFIHLDGKRPFYFCKCALIVHARSKEIWQTMSTLSVKLC